MSRRRERFPDRRSVGRSKHIPFVDGESFKDRHWRRLGMNAEQADAMREWCSKRGVKLSITNNGMHWQFQCPEGVLIEWWPSSAKLVIDKRWAHGIHVHDWTQAQRIVKAQMRKRSARAPT